MNAISEEAYLAHFGILGMKWGVRRYQNKDGSLTPAGQKRVEQQYKKEIEAAKKQVNKRASSIDLKAYNKTADELNSGEIERFNKKNNPESKDYIDKYNKFVSDKFAKNQQQLAKDALIDTKNYKKAQKLVEKYNMTSFSELARENEKFMKE